MESVGKLVPRDKNRSTGRPGPSARQIITMVDGRVFTSDDGWATITAVSKRGRKRLITDKTEADFVRFLVANGAAENA